MTPEQVERTIEFILEHHAQVTIQMQQLTGQTRDVQAAVLLLSDLAQIQSNRLDRQNEEMRQYREGQNEALARLNEILRRLTEKN